MAKMMSRLLREKGKLEIWAIVGTAEAALDALGAATVSRPGESSFQKDGASPLPDLVLVDISLPGMSGVDLLTELRRRYPDLPCLIVSAHSHPSYAQQVLDRGARGYVAKEEATAIIEAIKLVLKGEIYLSEGIRQALEE
jgi:DNA-binding NarL/FixJ family response regulator